MGSMPSAAGADFRALQAPDRLEESSYQLGVESLKVCAGSRRNIQLAATLFAHPLLADEPANFPPNRFPRNAGR